MMYEGEDTNTIDLLYEKPTNEENGVKVIVPINYSDRHEFREKIREQLAYFENVYFDCGDLVDNNFSIFRTEIFQFSELASEAVLHLCLDNVYYPIDFQKLGMKPLSFPVALRFSLTDGLFPTPNRESIRYTKEAKEIISKKIEELANFFVNKYNESVKDTDDVHALMDFYSNQYRYVSVLKSRYDAGILSEFSTIAFNEPKLKGINILNMKLLHRNKEYILGEYDAKYRIERGKWKECKHYYDANVYRYSNYNKVANYYIYNERINGNKKDYLKSIAPVEWNKQTLIIKKSRLFTLGNVRASTNYESYMDILGLRNIPKAQWRDAIKEFQSIVEMYTKTWKNLDELVVPQAFIDSKKKVRISIGNNGGSGVRRQKLKGEVSGKEASPLERDVQGQNSKFVPKIYQLENAHTSPCLHIYGSQEDKARLDALYGAFGKVKNKIKFIMFSEREINNLDKVELHNWIKLDKFMKGDTKPFKRIVTAYLIKNLVNQYRYTFDKLGNMEDISTELYNKMKTLNDYQDRNCVGYMAGDTEKTIFSALLEIAEANNLFDGEIYPIYQEVKSILEKFPFINSVFKVMSSWGKCSELQQVVVDLFKYNKQKVNLKHYLTIKLTEEKELTKELVDELIEE